MLEYICAINCYPNIMVFFNVSGNKKNTSTTGADACSGILRLDNDIMNTDMMTVSQLAF